MREDASERPGSDKTTGRSGTPWLSWIFFGALFFLGSADQIFATRLIGMNFRWGQLLLLAGAVAALPSAWRAIKGKSSTPVRLMPLLIAWGAFFSLYGFSALLSDTPTQSLIKLAWASFNILGALLICLTNRYSARSLWIGLSVACLAIAITIWIDSLWIYWHQADEPLLGLAQTSAFLNIVFLRPHAFHYEPSYAGAWLAIATPVMLIAFTPRRLWFLLAAIPLSAVMLVTSRTGIMSAVGALLVAGILALVRRERFLSMAIPATIMASAILIFIFFIPTSTRQYGELITMQFGFQGTLSRLIPGYSKKEFLKTPDLKTAEVSRTVSSGGERTRAIPADSAKRNPPAEKASNGTIDIKTPTKNKILGYEIPGSSEGNRIISYVRAVHIWAQNPIFGHGVTLSSTDKRLFQPVAINTWLEVLMESGVVGFLAFVTAIAVSIRTAVRGANTRALSLLTGALVAHFVINLNLTQTFPRLDYWLVIFMALRLTAETRSPKDVSTNSVREGLDALPSA